MSKWVLIEVENQNINEPDTYGSYKEAYRCIQCMYSDRCIQHRLENI